MLGSFHTAKTSLKCAGKFIKGSGAEDAFIECGLYGPKSVQTILGGTHYYRSFNGLTMLSEAIERLKFKAFWASVNQNLYKNAVEEFTTFQRSLGNLNGEDSRAKLEDLMQSKTMTPLLEALEQFSIECGKTSEQCKFWNEFPNNERHKGPCPGRQRG